LTQSWQAIAVRAVTHALALCAVALVLLITIGSVHAQSIRTADVTPLEIPAELARVRAQPAIGPTFLPPQAGEQQLTDQLLANYVERQKALRAFDVLGGQPGAELNTQTLMSYISRSAGQNNGALSAIASFAPPSGIPQEPVLDSQMLSRYIDEGFQPTARRVETANAERGCLAQAIYHEARGESEAGQMAVANVIVNRARSGKYPSTLCGVIYQNAEKGRYRCQFTFACDGRDDAPRERRAWARSTALAQSIYARFATGTKLGALPRSALFYHTTGVRPSWSNVYNQVAQIGSHIFYSPN
jgi:hypothetical protein